jgi:hypothetical protein
MHGSTNVKFDSSRRRAMLCGLSLRHDIWRRRSADVVGSCKLSDESPGSIKFAKFLDQMRNCLLLKSEPSSWNEGSAVTWLFFGNQNSCGYPTSAPADSCIPFPTVRDHAEEHVTLKAWVPPVDMDLLRDHCRVCLLTRNVYWLIQTISTTGFDTWLDPWFLFHLSLTLLLS